MASQITSSSSISFQDDQVQEHNSLPSFEHVPSLLWDVNYPQTVPCFGVVDQFPDLQGSPSTPWSEWPRRNLSFKADQDINMSTVFLRNTSFKSDQDINMPTVFFRSTSFKADQDINISTVFFRNTSFKAEPDVNMLSDLCCNLSFWNTSLRADQDVNMSGDTEFCRNASFKAQEEMWNNFCHSIDRSCCSSNEDTKNCISESKLPAVVDNMSGTPYAVMSNTQYAVDTSSTSSISTTELSSICSIGSVTLCEEGNLTIGFEWMPSWGNEPPCCISNAGVATNECWGCSDEASSSQQQQQLMLPELVSEDLQMENHIGPDSNNEDDQLTDCNEDNQPTVVFRVRNTDPGLLDGFVWRKYGQKNIKGKTFPRSYFRCANYPSCCVKKQTESCSEMEGFVDIKYIGQHNHQV